MSTPEDLFRQATGELGYNGAINQLRKMIDSDIQEAGQILSQDDEGSRILSREVAKELGTLDALSRKNNFDLLRRRVADRR